MADDRKKLGKTSGWVAVGDSMDGIRNLRPDVLKQKADRAKTIDAQIKKDGIPSDSSTKTPVARSSNVDSPPKRIK